MNNLKYDTNAENEPTNTDGGVLVFNNNELVCGYKPRRLMLWCKSEL